MIGRTPHGVRGLKSIAQDSSRGVGRSHPSRGAWIEIIPLTMQQRKKKSRTPHGVRGLKLMKSVLPSRHVQSHPSRGAWIEIRRLCLGVRRLIVAPLTGCVD